MADDSPIEKDAKTDKKSDSSKSDDAQKTSATASQASADSQVVVKFAGDIEIFTNKPMPKFKSVQNQAFKAVSKGRNADNLIAIVCEKHCVPRRNAASVYSSIINPFLLPLHAYGKVYWPPAKQERYIVVYKHVINERLLEDDKEQAMGLKQDFVMDNVVKPMVDILQDFRDKDFVHGAIRPSNMFTSSSKKGFVLGDCLSAQASSTQPALFETIERAQANSSARGVGTLTDDLYAFGVSLAVMMRAIDPLAGKDEEEVIKDKIVHGSYAAITGKDRFKGSILELLRGLLHDDPSQRWTVDEILVWLDGRRLSPKQALKRGKAARPFSFVGQKFLQPSLLAMAVDALPNETVRVMEDGSLKQWVERSLEDDLMSQRLDEAYQSSVQIGRGQGYEDRVVANIASVLDTMGPIRFRGQRLCADGVGSALYEAMVLKQDVKVFAALFMQSIAMNWVTATENPNLDVTGLISKFDLCKNFLRQNKFGFGLERCLYLLAPEAPCLSPKLENYYVSTPEDMMYAFEDICKKGHSPPLFLDRHSAAFLSVKDSKIIDSFLFDLNASEDHKNLIGNLKTLAAIQKRSNLDRFPHIAKTLNKRFPVLYKRFHDKKVREKLRENIEKFVKAGDLVKIANLLESPEVLEKDLKGFKAAALEYAQLRKEAEYLEKQLSDESTFGRSTGKEISALISGGLAALIIIVTTVMFFNDKSIF
ncbi:MAG: hypothetical protein AB8B83_09370 [Bdellovibrionales bacterium]